MDIVKTINGKEHNFCMPASWFVAEKIAEDFYENYEIKAEITGTGAVLKKYSKQKMIDFYDKEQIHYILSKVPPKFIGGFYWEIDEDSARYQLHIGGSRKLNIERTRQGTDF